MPSLFHYFILKLPLFCWGPYSITLLSTVIWNYKHFWVNRSITVTVYKVISYQLSKCKSTRNLFLIFCCIIFILLVFYALPHVECLVIQARFSLVGEIGIHQKVSSGRFLLLVMATDALLRTEKINFVFFVQLYAFCLFAKFVITFWVDSVVVFSTKKLIGVIVPNFRYGVKFSWVPRNVVCNFYLFRPDGSRFLCQEERGWYTKNGKDKHRIFHLFYYS